jgi:hypothetical protein
MIREFVMWAKAKWIKWFGDRPSCFVELELGGTGQQTGNDFPSLRKLFPDKYIPRLAGHVLLVSFRMMRGVAASPVPVAECSALDPL